MNKKPTPFDYVKILTNNNPAKYDSCFYRIDRLET